MTRAPARAGPLLQREASGEIAAAREAVFAVLDDHRRLAAHMTRPSLMIAGASVRIELDSGQGQAVGSAIRMRERVPGLPVRLEEVVGEYTPPHRNRTAVRRPLRELVRHSDFRDAARALQ